MLSDFSVAMKRHHDQEKFKCLIWGLQFQRVRARDHQGSRQAQHGDSNW